MTEHMTIDTKRLRALAEKAESEGGRVTLSPSIIHLVAIEIDLLRDIIERVDDILVRHYLDMSVAADLLPILAEAEHD